MIVINISSIGKYASTATRMNVYVDVKEMCHFVGSYIFYVHSSETLEETENDSLNDFVQLV